MKIQTIVAVEPNGKVTVHVPAVTGLQPGKHAGVLTVEENGKTAGATRLVLSRHDVGLKNPTGLRREELYGDNGR